MNVSKISKGLVLGLALLLATSVFALNKGSLQLSDPVIVNGKLLAAGDYTVKWDGSGPNVEVNILQGKNVVVKTTAHVVELPTPAANDAVAGLDPQRHVGPGAARPHSCASHFCRPSADAAWLTPVCRRPA